MREPEVSYAVRVRETTAPCPECLGMGWVEQPAPPSMERLWVPLAQLGELP